MTNPEVEIDPLDLLLAKLSGENPPRAEPVYKKTSSANTEKRSKPPEETPRKVAPHLIAKKTVRLEDTIEPLELKVTPHPLYSESNPRGFKFGRFVSSRFILIILVAWVLSWIMSNLVRGNWRFAYDFVQTNWLIQGFIHTIGSKQALNEWITMYGTVVGAVLITALVAGIVLHRFVWRLLFHDYIRFTEGVETNEGRAYWVEGAGYWFNVWDNWYGAHLQKGALKAWLVQCEEHARKHGMKWRQRRKYLAQMQTRALEQFKITPVYDPVARRPIITIYINYKRLPPNPFNPGRSMLKNRLNMTTERLERRGPYELIVHEGLYRRITGVREFATHSEGYLSSEIPVKYASELFSKRVVDLIRDTNRLSKANVKVRLDKLRSGTVLVDSEIRDMILHERNQPKA